MYYIRFMSNLQTDCRNETQLAGVLKIIAPLNIYLFGARLAVPTLHIHTQVLAVNLLAGVILYYCHNTIIPSIHTWERTCQNTAFVGGKYFRLNINTKGSPVKPVKYSYEQTFFFVFCFHNWNEKINESTIFHWKLHKII